MANNNLINNYALPLAGGTMVGDLILNADPSTGLQAATKQYVDMIGAGFNFEPSCVAGTTANLSATYSNGAAGMGATLTAVALTAFTIDGVTPALNDRVLIKNQTNTFENGIYTVTTLANVGVTPWMLTRATNYDQPAEINAGDLVITESGTTQAARGWLQNATVTTIGTDPIVFVMFGVNSVTSVTGTSNRITSTGGTTPVIDISSSYVGQSSITTTGALASGSLASGFTPVTVPLGGLGTSSLVAYAPIVGGTTSTGTAQSAITGISTAGYVLTSTGSSSMPTWQPTGGLTTGIVVQAVTTNYKTYTSTTSFFPVNDTIPVNTAGLQIMSVTITPQSATHTLVIAGTIFASANDSCSIGVGVFQDTTVNAIYATESTVANTDYRTSYPFSFSMVSGTTSATTFYVRVASQQSSNPTVYINGGTSGRVFGGVAQCNFTVTEIT